MPGDHEEQQQHDNDEADHEERMRIEKVGQRQRLALTRALVSTRPFVILDEPSAHLDAMNEKYVTRSVRALKQAGHTVVVIAHRRAILGEADNIIDVVATADTSAVETEVAQ